MGIFYEPQIVNISHCSCESSEADALVIDYLNNFGNKKIAKKFKKVKRLGKLPPLHGLNLSAVVKSFSDNWTTIQKAFGQHYDKIEELETSEQPELANVLRYIYKQNIKIRNIVGEAADPTICNISHGKVRVKTERKIEGIFEGKLSPKIFGTESEEYLLMKSWEL